MEGSLVSILMPVYSYRFFEEALMSAINQTYNNIEIIVSDDSPDDKINTIVDRSLGKRSITYIKNNPAHGPYRNYLACMSAAKGEYIKFLNDDDVLSERCVEKMAQVLESIPSVVLVTSSRGCIDEYGLAVKGHLSTIPIIDADSIVRARDICTSIVKLRLNLIGEPSTTMFRREFISIAQPNLMCWGGRPGYGAGDMAMWLNLLQHGNLFYFAEQLSQFRLHSGQRQHSDFVRQRAHDSWEWFLKHGKDVGVINNGRGWFVSVRENDSQTWKKVRVASTKMILRQLMLPIFRAYRQIKNKSRVNNAV